MVDIFYVMEEQILKKNNMKVTCVFDGLQAVEDIFSAFLLEEYEAERRKGNVTIHSRIAHLLRDYGPQLMA